MITRNYLLCWDLRPTLRALIHRSAPLPVLSMSMSTGLVCGVSEPSEVLPDFNEKLKAAGIKDLITDVQSQLESMAGRTGAGEVMNKNQKTSILFGEHMVLQRDKPVPVWGKSRPGDRIKVSYRGRRRSAMPTVRENG